MVIITVIHNNIIHGKGNLPSRTNRFEKNILNIIKTMRKLIEIIYQTLHLDSLGYKVIILFFTLVL